MIYHITYEFASESRDDAQTRFKATGALPPEGVAMTGRWHSIEGHCGFMIAETENAVALGKWLQEWTDLLNFEVTPVLNDEEIAAVIG